MNGFSRAIGIILFVVCTALRVSAQVSAAADSVAADGAAGESLEQTNVLKIKVGGTYQLDTYLSPLAYRGWQSGIANEWWQPFSHDTRAANWAHVGRLDVSGFRTMSTARSNSITGIDIHGGWGAFYCWRWSDRRLKLILGPYLEAGLTTRYINSNVNKPLSLDLAADMMAMGGISWSFYGRKTGYRLSYQARTNIIGFDCMPHYWQSYYELSEGVPPQIRCSGHWNHHTVKHELALDMQLIHSTWRVGVGQDYTNYHSDNLRFVHNTVNLIIGCIWDYHILSNKRL